MSYLKANWISVKDRLPKLNGAFLSDPVFVSCCEFGWTPVLAVARCWMSKVDGEYVGEPKWYLDDVHYNTSNPIMISQQVTHWLPMFKMPEYESPFG